MSRLDELIAELCPDGVPFKKLNEISKMKRGTSITKKDIIEGDIPVISGGKTPAYYCNLYNRDGETITVAGSGAGAGYVQYWNQPIFVCDAFSIKGNNYTTTKYLYYCLSNIQEYIYSTKKGGGVPHVHISDIENFKFPVPPIEVQKEIVRILDNFTKLTAELTAELTARQKQYEFYRDTLLTFDVHGGGTTEVQWKTLGEIAKIKNGKTYKNICSGEIPVYGSGGIMTYIGEYCYNKPSVLIPRKGSLSNLFYVDTPFWNVDTIFYTEIDEQQVVPKYLFYLLKKEHIERLNTAGGVPSLTQTVLNNISLAIPSITVQKRIVDVLDNFEKICNDLNIGLPAEIEARQKQYEYYRDKLLTFKEK